ncbi:MAG: isoleucine--tRNA ligase [Leptospiraceae bacterium]|nr:isoleucine--tRNA ligase [Leptospiraceae bacterium]MDW8307708.1 isoleucine--tRNA ligase [Leptospiraceae bacterium]
MSQKNPFAHTIYLPETKFPMKAELARRELQILDYWRKEKIYRKLQEIRKLSPLFVLHDGPPYANGNFHVGHALNKILKDIINKFKLLQGYRVPFIPGWDCHGLPIELAVLKKMSGEKNDAPKDPQAIRRACREYATYYIRQQAQDQSRFGVLWDDEEALALTLENQKDFSSFYYTMSPGYEAAILKAFADLYHKGYIYKGKRPVLWCPVTATAHAEAEVEYQEKISPSIYVLFPENSKDNRYVVIWTTTPWTLPANLAVAFHPEYVYAEYETPRGNFIIAQGLEEIFFKDVELSYSAKRLMPQKEIENLKVMHPFYNRKSLVVFSEHVTLEQGTGIVHTAPGHGYEDYLVGERYGLEPYCPVDEHGFFTDDVEYFAKMNIYEANTKIVELLKQKGLLLKEAIIKHQYPHSWRSHAPLIFRATEQWFFRLEPLRDLAIKKAQETKWIPPWGENRFVSTIKNRPDWCLSRQRYWGVPIPAFQCESCGKTILTKDILDNIISLVERHGLEVWFEKKADELLPAQTSCPYCGARSFRKEEDILDVWFDSGVSWYAVLQKHPQLSYPANLYLEGSDQHRGWFQASLWPALALNGESCYKEVLTHGYVLDEKGRAMSKSLGNVVSPREDVIDKLGADVLRLWVASEDYRGDCRLGAEILSQIAESYRKIRNTFRYMLSNLRDNPLSYAGQEKKIYQDIDLWVLHELSLLEKELREYYQNYEFHLVYHRLMRFCTNTLSMQYFDIIRDRLYCEGNPEKNLSSPSRESALATLAQIFLALNVMVAPILSFTAEEMAQLYQAPRSIFEQNWPDMSSWYNPDLGEKFKKIFAFKDEVNRQLEEMRKKGEIGSSLECEVRISPNLLGDISVEDLALYFVVSRVKRDSSITHFVVEKSQEKKCPRCWQYQPLSEKGLCFRCDHYVYGVTV